MMRFIITQIIARVLFIVLSSVTLAHAALIYEPQTTSGGIRYILVSGEFDYSDDLGAFNTLVRSHNPSVVTFNSVGGNLFKAMELGRLIRTHHLNTLQIRGMECASACSLAFIGGVSRLAAPGSIGVHKSSFSTSDGMSVDDAVSQVQQITADVITYMIEMGIDPGLLQLSLKYDSNDIRYLSGSEMAQFKVVTAAQSETVSAQANPPSTIAPAQQTTSVASNRFTLPEAKSGRVRHPKGQAPIKAQPDGKSMIIADLPNGTSVTIQGGHERWYEVTTSTGLRGFMHHTWVWVQQYDGGNFSDRRIQIKSFNNFEDAERFVKSSPLKTSAYLVTNGWFAVTLNDTFNETDGKQRVQLLKDAHSIPDDAFLTFPNTYVRKVCCN
ncbi:SH3 domain-containing protein [Phyllobacterium meliloti]|uniref:SH3 domain-containing protein n=1 Tax=Phyllobacterium meliloti TaxID=555317 RepID=UPI001D141312|nr:SH3 domain-containing protein [Phyllobacterium sp. T1293]UGX86172.1 SH3 domain-containing protein [Phyllobacterium sp. T1293]